MKSVVIVLGLVFILGFGDQTTNAFNPADFLRGQAAPIANQNQQSFDVGKLVCQFLSFLCPDQSGQQSSTTTQSSPANTPPINNQANTSQTPKTQSSGGLLGDFGALAKKLWGDNPPPTWGGISGGGGVPLPGSGSESGAPSSSTSEIASCVGSTATSCAYSCANSQATCKARGCFCVKNGPGAGRDCPNFIELSQNKQFGAALTECTGQQTGTGSGSSSTPASSPTGAYISQCGSGGDFGTCQSFCETNTSKCQKRLQECRSGGGTGDDCETFTVGYNYCCVTDKADCVKRNPKLSQVFCGATAAPVVSPTTKSPLEEDCMTTTDNCNEIFEYCSAPENRNQTLGCIGLENDCAKMENNAYCKSRGY